MKFTSIHSHTQQCRCLHTPAPDTQAVHLLVSRPRSAEVLASGPTDPCRLPVPAQQLALRPLLLPTGWSNLKLTSAHTQRLRKESAHTQEAVRNKINKKLGQAEVIKSRARPGKSTKQPPT